jgi:PAS domain S-box-containing protein
VFHLLRHKLQYRYPIVERRPFKSVRDRGALLQPLSRQQRTELYGRLFVPINLNTATDAEILTIPGVGQRMLREFKKYRPYKSMDQFRREIGKYVSKQEVAPLERYVSLNLRKRRACAWPTRATAQMIVCDIVSETADSIARRLAAIVESSDDAIVSKDLDGIVLTWNQAAERIFEYPAEEIIGSSIRRIIPDDRQSEEDQVLASIRAGIRVDHFETVRKTRTGRLIPISLTVSPILDASGVVIGASKIARDISERKRAEQQAARAAQRDAFLAEATLTLTHSLDYEQTLRTLARLAVPYLADYCAFDVIDQQGAVVRLATAHVLREKAEIAEDLRMHHDALDAPTSPQRVIRTGRASFIREITDEMLVASARGDKDRLERLRSLGLVSYLCAPMSAHDRTLGAMTIANAESGRHFSDDDVHIAHDIAVRSALAVEIAQSYQQLQSANRLKDEFLATLSHELRTPLNAVLGYARMLQSGAIANEKVAQALEVIDRNAGALAQIVEDVLDVSRIVLGKAKLRMEPVDAAVVVEDAVATVKPAADAKGLHLKIDLGHGAATVSGDHSRLQQVVWNLLSNAVKFTPRGGDIDIRVTQHDSHIEIVVRDTGVGFPASFRPHLFERFRQAESGPTRIHGGLGLGLSIAHHIVEMHGGTIMAKSDGEGKGATFSVMLPLSKASAARV